MPIYVCDLWMTAQVERIIHFEESYRITNYSTE